MNRYTPLFILLTLIALPLAAQTAKGGKTGPATEPSVGQTWAVVVGISKYQYVDKLNYADKDAEAFYQYLLSPAGGSIPQSNITLLTNEKATTAQIDKALGNLTSLAKPGDRVLLYFSGHGDQETRTIAQRGFLLTYDTFNTNYMAGAFSILFFQDYINTLSTRNGATVQVFLDACRAGKLAGNEAGGVQLTGEQLAKQAANETKLLACQSNEVSLEGPQWGGGRGAFSYHLVRVLQGLADVNPADGQVTVRELERYLEDHVSPEVAPVKQTPFKVGDANTVLARIDAPTLAALNANQPPPAFATIAGKGQVETAFAKADTQTVALYRRFQAKLDRNQPEAAIADYEQLAGNPQSATALPFLKRELAAALMDEGQGFLNQYLKSEKTHALSKDDRNRQIRQFDYAAKLLGSASSFYKPALARAAFFKGINAKFSNDTLATLTAYQQAIMLDSTAAFAYNEQGGYLHRLKRYQEGEKACRKGLRFAPNWPYLYTWLGILLAAQKRPEEAEEAYRKAIQLKPDYAGAHYNLGTLLTAQKRPEEAEEAYRKAIQLEPDYAEAYNGLGILWAAQNRPVEAEEAYRKAIQLKPDLSDAYSNLGNWLDAQKRPEEAEEAYRKAVQVKPDLAIAYGNLGSLLAQQGRYQEAIPAMQSYVKLLPNEADGWDLLGALFMNLKQYPDAKRCLERSLALNPKHIGAPYNLACLYSRQNQPAPALQWLEKALQNGFADFAHIAEDTDLDSIRQTDGFKDLLKKYQPTKP